MEILPAVLTWTTLLGAVALSYFLPFWVAIYIIVFDVYWVLKSVNTAMHLLSSFQKLRIRNRYDWRARLTRLGDLQDYKESLARETVSPKLWRRERKDLREELERLDRLDVTGRNLDFRKVYHLVILPSYRESLEVLEASINSVASSDFPARQVFFVLALEQRGGEEVKKNGELLREKWRDVFFGFQIVVHPDGLPGEIKAKGANLTYAAREAVESLKRLEVSLQNVVVSAFDSDTIVSKNYFSYLTYAFLTAEKPYRTSYQPMPVYNNNIWDAPAITRVVAVANSFWQMVEASRPDRLVTFSSHAMSLQALLDVDFWPTDVVSDDSRIFWRCWLKYDGDYRTMPLFTTVSLDTMLDETYFLTLLGQYKQKRRWAWGVENFPYLVTESLKNPAIPFWKKFLYMQRMLEGFYFWATASIIIAVLGWLPLLLGGARFDEGALAFNLPLFTRLIMQIATLFLIFSVYINMILLPRRPEKYTRWRTVNMILQWIFVPIVSTIFGSLPAIDAQTRLAMGRYLEFWVTPKARKTKIPEQITVGERTGL